MKRIIREENGDNVRPGDAPAIEDWENDDDTSDEEDDDD
jgi:hypothetical protein